MNKRVYSIVGHFGSGKTEFAVNYVLDLRKTNSKVAILDMDIANPYFRSRERQDLMKEQDIDIHFNTYGYDINEDLPAITATLRAPLENRDYVTVVDVGGNDSGARIINQFRKYFLEDDACMLAVLNLNRPDTETPELCCEQIRSIEEETGIKIDGIINNTHMLMETTPDDIVDGYERCLEVSEMLGIPVVCSTCVENLIGGLTAFAAEKDINIRLLDVTAGDELVPFGDTGDAKNSDGVKSHGAEEDSAATGRAANVLAEAGEMRVYPLTLQMRPSWLDIEI